MSHHASIETLNSLACGFRSLEVKLSSLEKVKVLFNAFGNFILKAQYP